MFFNQKPFFMKNFFIKKNVFTKNLSFFSKNYCEKIQTVKNKKKLNRDKKKKLTLKNSNCDQAKIVTKLKTQFVTKLKKTQIVDQLKKSNCNKAQKLKL